MYPNKNRILIIKMTVDVQLNKIDFINDCTINLLILKLNI